MWTVLDGQDFEILVKIIENSKLEKYLKSFEFDFLESRFKNFESDPTKLIISRLYEPTLSMDRMAHRTVQ